MSAYQDLNHAKVLFQQLAQLEDTLEKLIEQKEKELKKYPGDLPLGTIRIKLTGRKHNTQQYFWYSKPGNISEMYIKKSELDPKKVKAMIQREYDEKILKAAREEYRALKNVKKFASGEPLIAVFNSMGRLKQEWITPVVSNDSAYVKKWISKEFSSPHYKSENQKFITKQNENVRSKSELLIANALHDHNIPYRYECPLTDSYNTWALPDFTVLNVRLRKELFWEHFGMMGEPEYCSKALQKIVKYEEHNMFAGQEIIYTFESDDLPLDTRSIERIIQKYLL